MTNNTATLSFGVKPSALVKAATRLTMVGTAYLKAGKLVACAAILSGADIDDVSLRTGVKPSALRRIVSIVNNGRKATDNVARVTPAQASEALHGLDWEALTNDAPSDDAARDAQYDATIEAANVWDAMFADVSAGGKTDPKSLSDLLIGVSDALAAGVLDNRWTEEAASAGLLEAAEAFGAVVSKAREAADAA